MKLLACGEDGLRSHGAMFPCRNMQGSGSDRSVGEKMMRIRLLVGLGIATAMLTLAACGKKEETTAATPAAASSEGAAGAAAATPDSWTPERLEELLAPVALYPDVVLGHVLSASTNPQEVLDAGNWLIENQGLTGAQIDKESEKLGLSPSTRALLQFPEAMDMMCMQMDWTTELGQAFTADQGAVLDAVQRLRAQAKDVGNLQSSPQLKVATETQEGKEVITVDPPSPEVVYVPKYDPEAVYAPPPATIPPPSTINITPAPGTTTTVSADGSTTTVTSAATPTTTTTEAKGHSTGALVTTGLLAFGAGILVNEIFDDDDDWYRYGPNYGYGGMYYGGRPYYPPPPYMYRPPYGNGYYPSHGYNRPPNYQHGFNNNVIIVNNGGNNYWNRNSGGVGVNPVRSPITVANPRRNDLNQLNRQARERDAVRLDRRAGERPAIASRDAKSTSPRTSGYAGALPQNKTARDKMIAKAPPTGVARDLPTRPKTEYKGASNRPQTSDRMASAKRPTAANLPTATRETPKPRPAGMTDRGRPEVARAPMKAKPATAQRPTPQAKPATAQRPTPQAKPATAQRPTPQAKPATAQRAQPANRTAFDASRGGGGARATGSSERKASARGRSSKGSGGGQKTRKPGK